MKTPGNHCLATGVALVLVFGVQGCAPPEPLGLSIEELHKEGLAPLEVVSFMSASGAGDAVLGSVIETEDDISIQRYVLKLTNVSNCEVTGFRGVVTFVDDEGANVQHEQASKEVSYAGDFSQGIPPNATVELEQQLLVPKGATAKFAFVNILYKDGGLGGIWKAEGR